MVLEYHVHSQKREQFIDITSHLAEAVAKAKIDEGVVTVFVPHTTAAVTINENADPSVRRDILVILAKLVPEHGDYHHAEGNSDAHLKASLFGASERVLVQHGKLVLGMWQSVFFTEFDGPRNRRIIVHVEGRNQNNA